MCIHICIDICLHLVYTPKVGTRHARTKTWVICDTYHSQKSCINTEKSPIHTFKQPFVHLNVWYKACHTTIRRAVKSPFVIIFYFFLFIWYTWGRRCEPVSCQFKSCSTIFFNFLFLIFWYAGGCRSEHVPCQTAIRRAVDFFVFLFLFVIFWYAGGRCCKRAPCHTTIRRAVASFLFLFSIIVWFGMQKGAATHVSHVTQELLNFFFFVHYCFDWYAGERRYTCVPCHKRIRNANWKFFLFIFYFLVCRRAPLWMCPMLHTRTHRAAGSLFLWISFFFLFFPVMQEGAAVNVSHVTQQYEMMFKQLKVALANIQVCVYIHLSAKETYN